MVYYMYVDVQVLPKDLTPERADALLSFLPESLRFGEFRRAMIAKASALPLKLIYGLGTSVEYPEIMDLCTGTTSARHDIRMHGRVILGPLVPDSDLGKTVFEHVLSRATTIYRALPAALFSAATVVSVEGEGSLHLSTTLAGLHAELIVVHAKRDARLVVAEQFKGKENRVSARIVMVIAEEGAAVEYRTQATDEIKGSVFLQKYGIARKGASIKWYEVSETGERVKTEVETDLSGEESSSAMYFSEFNAGVRQLDALHVVRHLAPFTMSRIAATGASREMSRLFYRGDIDIAKGMKRADGRQEAKFIVLDKTAKVDAVPALNIGEGDVAASHALSVGYLSPLQMFYPKTRGMTEKEARGFLISGIMKGVLHRGGASDRDAYEMSRIAEVLDKNI